MVVIAMNKTITTAMKNVTENTNTTIASIATGMMITTIMTTIKPIV